MLTIRHVPVTNRSSSIAVGAVAQDVYTAAQQPKHGFEFQNTSDIDMWLAWDTDASQANGIRVPAGALYYRPGPDMVMPVGRLSVYAATSGKTFTCNCW